MKKVKSRAKKKLTKIEEQNLLVSKLIKILLIIIMIAIPTVQVIRMQSLYYGDVATYDNFNVSCIVYGSLPFLIAAYVYGIVRKTYKIDMKDYILYFLAITAIISTIFAIDVNTSLLGVQERYEGLFAIIFYYLLILVTSSVADKKFAFNVLNVFLGIGIVQGIYAYLQVLVRPHGVLGFVLAYMANGFCGNPNFLGAFMSLALLLSIGAYLFASQHNKFYFVCSIFFALCIVLANSFGPLTGILVASIVLLIWVAKKRKELLKKCVLVLAVSALTIFVGAYAVDEYCANKFGDVTMAGYTLRSDFDEILGVIFNRKSDATDEIIEKDVNNKTNTNVDQSGVSENVSKEKSPISMINGRGTIWEDSLEIAKENLWFGVGLDNFSIIYQQKFGMYIDKAHNVYLNILVNNGIFAAVGYVGLLIYILVKGLKNANETSMILLITFIGYAIQVIFGISVLFVAPYFYILSGLILGFAKKEQAK